MKFLAKLVILCSLLVSAPLLLVPAEATISTTAPRNDYVGNGATATYSYTFKIFAATDLRVTTRTTANVETTLTYPTDYTVTGVGNSSGGTITLTAGALTTDYALTIRFDRTPRQSTDLRNQGSFFAETHETKFDELTRYAQQLEDVVDRSLHLPETEVGTAAKTTLPVAEDRASKFMAWDADGNPIAAAGTSADLTPVSAFMGTMLDDASAVTARTTLGFPTVSGATTGHALVVDPAASGGMSWNHRAQPNPIINGNMEIWQRGTTFAAAANASFSADRWRWGQSGTGVVTIARSTNVPTVAQAGVLFNYSLHVEATTADASIGATDFYVLSQRIEGYNWRAFAQRGFTLSFWVLSAKAGQHAVAFRNSGSDRTYVGTYTSSGAVWERHTITVPASPSAGTWDYTTGTGLEVAWVLEAGSNFHTTAGAWQTGNFYSTSSQADLLDTIGNDFLITGVKLELGSVATPIQFVPFEEELARCQRYYQKSFDYATAPAQNAGTTGAETVRAPYTGTTGTGRDVQFSVRMRTTPSTVTLYNPSAANAQARNVMDGADDSSSAVTARETGMFVGFTPNAANTAGDDHMFHWTASAEL